MKPRWGGRTSLIACLLAGLSVSVVHAQTPAAPPTPAVVPAPLSDLGFVPLGAPDTSATSSEVTTTSIQKVLGPYGDPGGLRAFLKKRGITYSFTYVGEMLGNATGGLKRGVTYDGRLDGEIDIDLTTLVGLQGAKLHSNFYQIHGRGLSAHNLMDLFTVSGIEAFPDTKLYEAWFEQQLFDGKLSIALGQFASDADFLVSQTASVFVNSSYGFPAIYANNLPSSGASYPFAALGARVILRPVENVTFVTALLDGDPANTAAVTDGDPALMRLDPGGVNLRLRDPPLLIDEAQFYYNQKKDDQKAGRLPGVVKIGYFHHFGSFPNYAATGPAAGTAMLRGSDGAYALIDQSVYREPDKDQGASIFVRLAGAPRAQSLIDVYIDGGIAYQGLLPGRGDDTIGLSGGFARISPDVTRGDLLSGTPLVRDHQALVEATYQYVVTSGFTLQPDFQYVFHPGADGVAGTDGRPLHDAAIFGLRATVVY